MKRSRARGRAILLNTYNFAESLIFQTRFKHIITIQTTHCCDIPGGTSLSSDPSNFPQSPLESRNLFPKYVCQILQCCALTHVFERNAIKDLQQSIYRVLHKVCWYQAIVIS